MNMQFLTLLLVLCIEISKAFKNPCQADKSQLPVSLWHLCDEHPDVGTIIERGHKLGQQECEQAFKDSAQTGTRWNCTNLTDSSQAVQPRDGSRENAALTSFTAAAIMYLLIKECESGKMTSCTPSALHTCEKEQGACKQFNWKVPMALLNEYFEPNVNAFFKEQVKYHNRKVGFNIVKELRFLKETCFGYGTCIEQESLLPISNLRSLLVKKYKDSKKARRKRMVARRLPKAFETVNHDQLIYYRTKYNYCGESALWNWKGIGRRECQVETRDSFALENCRNLCCGYGYIALPRKVKSCRMTKRLQRECKEHEETRYYCKYSNEASRRPTRT